MKSTIRVFKNKVFSFTVNSFVKVSVSLFLMNMSLTSITSINLANWVSSIQTYKKAVSFESNMF